MYKMYRKQLDRIRKMFALIIQKPRTPPPAPAQVPAPNPLQQILGPTTISFSLLVFYNYLTYPANYEITPIEHQKIMSTNV